MLVLEDSTTGIVLRCPWLVSHSPSINWSWSLEGGRLLLSWMLSEPTWTCPQHWWFQWISLPQKVPVRVLLSTSPRSIPISVTFSAQIELPDYPLMDHGIPPLTSCQANQCSMVKIIFYHSQREGHEGVCERSIASRIHLSIHFPGCFQFLLHGKKRQRLVAMHRLHKP